MTTPDVYTLTRRAMWQGARASVPLGVASAVLGAGFGVAARQVDLALWATLFMSGTVFAGAAQFAVLPLWHAPLPLAPIWFSTFAVNARFSLLSASLTSWLKHYGGATPWITAGLIGEGQWAIATRAYARGERDLGVLIGSSLVVWVVWMAGTATGFLAAPSLGDPRRFGLDLVLLLFFASTLTSGWRGPRDLVPWSAAAAATRIPASIVAPEWQVLVAALVGASVGAWRDTRR
jgi:predicted branched-subunit amino acid permease